MSTILGRSREQGRAAVKSKANKAKVDENVPAVVKEGKENRLSQGSSSSASLSPEKIIDKTDTKTAKKEDVDMVSSIPKGRTTRRSQAASQSRSPLKEVEPTPKSTRGRKKAVTSTDDKTLITPATGTWSIAATEDAPSVDTAALDGFESDVNMVEETVGTKGRGKTAKRKLTELASSTTKGRGGRTAVVLEPALEEEPITQPAKRSMIKLDSVCGVESTAVGSPFNATKPNVDSAVPSSSLPRKSLAFIGGALSKTFSGIGGVASAVIDLASAGMVSKSQSFQELRRAAVKEKRAMESALTSSDTFDPNTAPREEITLVIQNLQRTLQAAQCANSLQSMETQTKLTCTQKELTLLKQKLASAENYAISLEENVEELKAGLEAVQEELERETERLTAQLANLEAELAAKEQEYGETIADLQQQLKAMNEAMKTSEAKATAAEEEKTYALEKYKESDDERRRLLEEVLNLKGAVRVFCRVRPLTTDETEASTHKLFAFPGTSKECTAIQLAEPPAPGVDGRLRAPKITEFGFNRVFSPLASQEEMFEEARALVSSMADGNKVCIFAYGQTGSGKTFTMQGPETASGIRGEYRGLIPRSLEHLFHITKLMSEDGWRTELTVECVEVYNETFRDLLSGSAESDARIDIHADKSGNNRLTNITTVRVSSPAESLDALAAASRNRVTASTKCNEHSSRSHMVFTVRLEGVHTVTGQCRSGVLNLVDLAGSERLSKSMAGDDPKTLKETQAINTSLSVFGQVFSALVTKSNHVPFRSSKLTHLLQGSLTGGSKALMICNLCPLVRTCQESMCTLKFASNVSKCITS